MLLGVQSLSGHSSPIASVMFSNAEDQVVAGSLSGAIKIWDLEAAKSKINVILLFSIERRHSMKTVC